jgi:hypothetical protein
MEHGEEILDLELMDRIDLHDPTAVCDLLRILPAAFSTVPFS